MRDKSVVEKVYRFIGNAKDISDWRERLLYRFLEIIPGVLVWGTFGLIIAGSAFYPFATVVVIILFALFWFFKTIYLNWHLRTSFKVLRESSLVDWLGKLDELDLSRNPLGIKKWNSDLWHLVVIPFYREDYAIIRNTLRAISEASYPQNRIMVVLSGEDRAGGHAEDVGRKVESEFGNKFGAFLFTVHQDAVGELAGKGANETWAIREAQKEIIDKNKISYEIVVVSVFDVDTIVPPQYFARLAYAYLATEKPLRTSFQPVPLFVNNIWEATAVSRVMAFSSSFWHLLNQLRPERLVSFSSHAFPFAALVEIGFWQVNVVSEDSRIFWQGLFTFDGDWRVEPLHMPISMDANVAETFPKTLKNIYLQQRRWAYGVADVPYMFYGFLKNKKIPIRTKLYWAFHHPEGFWSWATNSLIIFVMGWIPIVMGGKVFGTSVVAYTVPKISSWILNIALFGIITSVYLTFKILPPRPVAVAKHTYAWIVLQWFLVPFTLIINSFPAIEAVTRLMFGKYLVFWPTPKVRKGLQMEVVDPSRGLG